MKKLFIIFCLIFIIYSCNTDDPLNPAENNQEIVNDSTLNNDTIIKGDTIINDDNYIVYPSLDTIYNPYSWSFDSLCYMSKITNKILNDTIHYKHIPTIYNEEDINNIYNRYVKPFINNDSILFYGQNYHTFSFYKNAFNNDGYYFIVLVGFSNDSILYSNVNEDIICNLFEIDKLNRQSFDYINENHYWMPLYSECYPDIEISYEESYNETNLIKRKAWRIILRCYKHKPKYNYEI